MNKSNLIISSICLIVFFNQASGQYTSKWLIMAEPVTNGHTMFCFNGNFLPLIIYDTTPLRANMGFTNITDQNGNFFYSNGFTIFSSDLQPVMNGDSLVPVFIPLYQYLGHGYKHNCMILPKPYNEDSLFIFLHYGRDSNVYIGNILQTVSINLYYSVLNSSANNGEGEVILKSQMLINDTLASGKLSACRHANGRDWWIFCRKAMEAAYYRFLLTPDSIIPMNNQSFSGVLPPFHSVNFGNSKSIFTPDGNKFIQFGSLGTPADNNMIIFDFDRCNGILSNPLEIFILNPAPYNWYNITYGAAVSPNSRYLYVATGWFIFQYDLTASNIAGSKQTVAFYDSTYCPLSSPSPLYFGDMKLADDNRVYISSGGCYADVIHYPDSSASACSLVVHNFQINSPLNRLRFFPYHPDYPLGPLSGSPCDTLTGYLAQQINHASIRISPNPGPGYFKLSLDAPLLYDASPEACVYDITGRAVLKQRISAQVSYLDLTKQNDGIYLLRVVLKGRQFNAKLIKQSVE